jgi:hypothetical protein
MYSWWCVAAASSYWPRQKKMIKGVRKGKENLTKKGKIEVKTYQKKQNKREMEVVWGE